MFTGRCLCGSVRFEIGAPLGPIIHCHCSMCRRANGSAFATNATVRADAFRIVAGEELVREFESSPRQFRAFCARCGSPVYGRHEMLPMLRRVRLGALDGDPGARAVAHIQIGSKAPWYDVADRLDQFDDDAPLHYFAPG
jgi:hypothetical protein